jgi:hypothetical protein
MNTIIPELKDLITSSLSPKDGVKILNTFFKDCLYHPQKTEYEAMSHKDKLLLVKTLIETPLNPEENRQDTTTNENLMDDTDKIIDVKIEENNEKAKDEEEQSTEEPEIDHSELLLEREQLLLRLKELNLILNCDDVKPQTKMDICNEWKLNNPEGTRAQFMKDNAELGSKAMLSTYFYQVKNQK